MLGFFSYSLCYLASLLFVLNYVALVEFGHGLALLVFLLLLRLANHGVLALSCLSLLVSRDMVFSVLAFSVSYSLNFSLLFCYFTSDPHSALFD